MDFKNEQNVQKILMKGFLVFWTFAVIINVNAQSPHTNLSIGTGVIKSIATHDAISPYTYKGTNVPLRLACSRQKRSNEHNLQFSYCSIQMKSDNANIPSIPSKFYLLQYSLVRQVVTQKKTKFWVGPGISTRASIRQSNFDTTGEAIGSLEIQSKALLPLSKLGKVDASFNIPLVSFLVYRKYGLSEASYETVSWGKYQSFQLQFAYSIPLSQRVEFALGYDFIFYNYKFIESVKVVNQQYYCALRINLQKDANNKK